jgi:hypothetical protein
MHGILWFHRGWTDIINSLSFIEYFKEKYELLIVLSYKTNENIFRYYCRGKSNVSIYVLSTDDDLTILKEIDNIVDKYKDVEKNYIGLHDRYRVDKYNAAYLNYGRGDDSLEDLEFINQRINFKYYFVNKFYEAYNIPFTTRVTHFDLKRDEDLEDAYYKKNIRSEPYIVLHDTPSTVMPLERKSDAKYFQLDNTTPIFFDAIKVLENATEIHLIDSVWAALCYILDVKYKIFRNKSITVYCIRGHDIMFKYPVKLDHWNIVSYKRLLH